MRFDASTSPETAEILEAAIAVHAELNTGFLEKTYEEALSVELAERGIDHSCQVAIPITYRGRPLSTIYRADMIVGRILVELKATSGLTRNDEAQVIHYLKATGIPVALLINFGTYPIEVRRFVGPTYSTRIDADAASKGAAGTSSVQ